MAIHQNKDFQEYVQTNIPGIKFKFHAKSDCDYPSHTDMSSFNHLVTNDDITCQ